MIVLTEEKKMKHLKIKLQGKGEVGPVSWNFLQISWIEIPWGAKICNEIQIPPLSFEGWSCWVYFCISYMLFYTLSLFNLPSWRNLWCFDCQVHWAERKTRRRNGNTEHYTEHYTYQPYHQYHKFHPIYPLTESDPHTNECNSPPQLLIFSQTFRSRIFW